MHRYKPKAGTAEREAWDLIGGLSFPSKMPCAGYSIPADTCQVGGELQGVVGSTCSNCYACKGFYCMPNVESALWGRYGAVTRATDGEHSQPFIDAFVTVLWAMHVRTGVGLFRWHDSGDLQSLDHLEIIVRIAKACPHIKFWLPTREYRTVKLWCDLFGDFPPNLTVRLSAHMTDSKASDIYGLPTSEVHTTSEARVPGTECLAPLNDGECGACRKCWDIGEYVVSYQQH